MRIKYKHGGAEPPINHPPYDTELPSYTPDLRRICQFLANSERAIRHHALSFLPRALEENLFPVARTGASSTTFDAEKAAVVLPMLWKAFFFLVWHEDGVEQQDHVTHLICSLPDTVTSMPACPELLTMWVREAFTRVQRDWPTIDKWRMDKFLYFVRRLLYTSMRMISCAELVRILHVVFQQAESYPLAAHLVDVFLDECMRSPPLPAASILTYLRDLFACLLTSHAERALHRRIQKWVIDPLCANKLTADVPTSAGDPVPSVKTQGKRKRGRVDEAEEEQRRLEELRRLEDVPYQFCEYLDECVTAHGTRDGNRGLLMSIARAMRDLLPMRTPKVEPTQRRTAKRARETGASDAVVVHGIVSSDTKTPHSSADYLVVDKMPTKLPGVRAPVDVERAPHERAKSKLRRKIKSREKRMSSQKI